MGEHRRLLGVALLFSLFSIGLGLYQPFILRYAVDALEGGDSDARQLTGYALAFLGIGLLSAMTSRWMRLLPMRLIHKINQALRRDVFRHLLRLDDGFYRDQHTGDIMTRMNSDILAIGQMCGQGYLNAVRAVFAFGVSFIIMFRENVEMAVVMAILLPLMSATGFGLILMLRKYWVASQEQFSTISNFTQENFAAMRLIKGFGIEDRQQQRFGDLNAEYLRRNMSLNRIEAPVWPLLGLMFGCGSAVILWIGGRQVIAGELSLGTLLQFQQYLLFLQWPTLSLGWVLSMVVKGRASWGRVQALMDPEPAVADPPRDNSQPLAGDIEFRHVSLQLGGIPVLKDICLTLPEGQTLGITGPTGSGKTLLASLLVRRQDPDEGQVFIGIQDIRSLPVRQLRDYVRVAPQEPFLFSTSLSNNLSFGEVNASAEQIEWASSIAQLHDEVDRFTGGYQTVLGERGVTLSGGQRQRSSIARALLGNPQILILDDTLSAVDTQTEASILRGLLPVLRERTSLMISHRVSTLRYADRIVVLDQGQIIQQGTHAELTAAPGFYRELDIAQRLEARLEAI